MAARGPASRILVGCCRGMGDLLYVSAALGRLRTEAGSASTIHVAAGRGLWADAVRHLPYVDRVIPVESWEEIVRLKKSGDYDRVALARVKNWMPPGLYRAWTLRARIEGLHLIDILARTVGVRLCPEERRPVYFFSDDDPDDDPRSARSLGRFALLALHGFTHAGHNEDAERRILGPLVASPLPAGCRFAVCGPKGGADLPPSVVDLRGEPIRRAATYVREAALVISVLNGITVLADALGKPIFLLPFGKDPVDVVGPVATPPVATFGRPGREGAAGVDVAALIRQTGERLEGPG